MSTAFRTSGHDQAATRNTLELLDQHGRRWGAVIDVKSQGTIGAIRPLGWRAPLMPKQKYITRKAGVFNGLTIDYDRWVRDIREAHRRYNELLLRTAHEMYGDRAANALEERPAALLHRIGRAPEPVEPVLAARANNAWVLGLEPREPMPKWAEPFFIVQQPEEQVIHDELAFLREDEDDAAPEVQELTHAASRARTSRTRKQSRKQHESWGGA